MFNTLEAISARPALFETYTAESLWTDEYRARQMLAFHLNAQIDVSSRKHAFIGQSVNWMSKQFLFTNASRICDFGCGPGLYTQGMAQKGAQVTGIDFSENSIEYARNNARQAGLDIEYFHGNYLEIALPGGYDLITLIMCDFCALSPQQRSSLLTKFHECLNPQGQLLLDVYSVRAFDLKEESAAYERNQLNHFWYKEDYFCFTNSFKYETEKVILDKYTLFPKHGQQEEVFNWLQCFTPDELAQELKHSGFSVTAQLADVSGRPYDASSTEFAIIARKI